MQRLFSTLATLLITAPWWGCGGATPAQRDAVQPPPFDATSAALPFARELIERARDDRLETLRDHDGRLALAYVLYKHVAMALHANPETRAVGEPMVWSGRSLAACALYHAFIYVPATHCLEHAAEVPVPEAIARLAGPQEDCAADGEAGADACEPRTLGEVADPLVAANEAREEEKRARLAALDPASCELTRLTSFGGEQDGATRSAIGEAVGISLAASAWLVGVERFHYATLDCGADRLSILLSQYAEGAGRSGEYGARKPRRLHYLSWHVDDSSEPGSDGLHDTLRAEDGTPGDPSATAAR